MIDLTYLPVPVSAANEAITDSVDSWSKNLSVLREMRLDIMTPDVAFCCCFSPCRDLV